MMAPWKSSLRSLRPVRIRADGSRGGSFMMPGRAASTPSAMAGGPSEIMATHRICAAPRGETIPRNGAAKTVSSAPMFVES